MEPVPAPGRAHCPKRAVLATNLKMTLQVAALQLVQPGATGHHGVSAVRLAAKVIGNAPGSATAVMDVWAVVKMWNLVSTKRAH